MRDHGAVVDCPVDYRGGYVERQIPHQREPCKPDTIGIKLQEVLIDKAKIGVLPQSPGEVSGGLAVELDRYNFSARFHQGECQGAMSRADFNNCLSMLRVYQVKYLFDNIW